MRCATQSWALVALLFAGSTAALAQVPSDGVSLEAWTPVRIEAVGRDPGGNPGPERITFRNGEVFDTGMYDVEFLGHLRTRAKPPYLLLAARPCGECDIQASLYVQSPADGPIKDHPTIHHELPGRIFDWATDSLLYESRVFFGNCLFDLAQGVVSFERFLSDGVWEEAVWVARVEDDVLTESHVAENPPLLDEALSVLPGGKCREIPGRIQQSTP